MNLGRHHVILVSLRVTDPLHLSSKPTMRVHRVSSESDNETLMVDSKIHVINTLGRVGLRYRNGVLRYKIP